MKEEKDKKEKQENNSDKDKISEKNKAKPPKKEELVRNLIYNIQIIDRRRFRIQKEY